MRTLLLVLSVLVAGVVAQAAPKDSRTARLVNSLDLLRNEVVVANAQMVITTPTTRMVVTFYTASRKLTDVQGGCQEECRQAISISLFKLMSNPGIPESELVFLQPYLNLVKSVLDSKV